MKWLTRASPLLRDIGITATGLAFMWSQLILWAIADRPPSDTLLGAGLGLLGFPMTIAIRTVYGARTGEAGSSSSPSPPPPSLPSSQSSRPEVAHGEG